MYKNKRYLAFIPARGGSKGIPGKNIIDVCGKPLIAYTIQAAKHCEYIDEIIVSTDSEEIADVARKYGATVPFLRPEHLALDTSKTIDSVLYTINEIEEEYDALVLLQPTSPLRDDVDVTMAIEAFEETEQDLVSVSEVNDSPVLIRTIENGELKPMLEGSSTIRRQDMPEYLRVNGAIYINSIDKLDENTSFNDNKGFYRMKPDHSVDVDTYADLALVNYFIEQNMK